MADTYTTEAIACGLSDVAGWLENEGGREKHARTIRLGVERLRELGGTATEREPSSVKTMRALKDLSDAATPGVWYTVDTPWGDGTWIVAGNPDPHAGTMVCDCQDVNETRPEDGPSAADDAAFIATLVTAYRLGELVPASLAALGTGEGSGGASFGSGSREPGPTVPASGFDPSRIELAARAAWEHQGDNLDPDCDEAWASTTESARELWRSIAKVMLSAADGGRNDR